MFVVYSEVTWGYDGGSSTSLHAICSTEEEANNLVTELYAAETDTSDESPDYMYEAVGTPDKLSFYHETNRLHEEERFDNIAQNKLSSWIAAYKGVIVFKTRQYNTSEWDKISHQERYEGFLKYSTEKSYIYQWYCVDPEKYESMAKEACDKFWENENVSSVFK